MPMSKALATALIRTCIFGSSPERAANLCPPRSPHSPSEEIGPDLPVIIDCRKISTAFHHAEHDDYVVLTLRVRKAALTVRNYDVPLGSTEFITRRVMTTI